MPYALKVSWCKGKLHEAADALSRSPVGTAHDTEELAELAQFSIRAMVSQALDNAGMDLRLEEVRRHADSDPVYQQLYAAVLDGFPESKVDVAEPLREY